MVAVLGPNGAGKTTLLKIAAGLVSPTEGEVRVRGKRLKYPPGNRISYLGHSHCLYLDLTVMENIDLQIKLQRGSNGRASVREDLEELGLWERRMDPVRDLSQGMKRRLALLKVFLTDADILVLDEPLVGIDLRWTERITEKIKILKSSGKGILMTTHSIDEALSVADRIALLKNGVLTSVSRCDELDRGELIFCLRETG